MDSVNKKSLLLFALVLVVTGCVALAGCSSGSQASSSSASESASMAAEAQDAEDAMLVIGEKTDTALDIVFTNKLGVDITNLAVVPAGSEEEPALLMDEDETFANLEDAIVYAEPLADGGLYDVVIVCDDTTYVLHDMNFDLLETAIIRLEGDVAYIETEIDGSLVSSLVEEYDRAHPATENADDSAADEEVYYDETVSYEEPVYYGDAPAQSEDTCVSDVVLN